MDEKRTDQAPNQEYTVKELLDRLMADTSWQPDPARRAAAIGKLKYRILSEA